MTPRCNFRRTSILLLSLALLLGMTILGGGFYLQELALKADGNPRGKDIQGSYAYMFDTYPHIRPWVDSLLRHNALRDTFITAPDGAQLHALYVHSPQTGRRETAVIVHGYTDNAVRMLHIGYLYHKDLGYHILLPDLRYSGLSDGDHLQMGWQDRLDVLRWMDVASHAFGGDEMRDSCRMVVHGISMGGATTVCVSGEPQPPYVRCYVEDCGFTSAWDEFANELDARFGLPPMPLLYVASALTKMRYGWSFGEASARHQVERCALPMLFIHGDADTFVPTWMGDSLYAAKSGVKEYWRVPGTAHATSYLDHRDKYTEKVKKFVSRYMTVRR